MNLTQLFCKFFQLFMTEDNLTSKHLIIVHNDTNTVKYNTMSTVIDIRKFRLGCFREFNSLAMNVLWKTSTSDCKVTNTFQVTNRIQDTCQDFIFRNTKWLVRNINQVSCQLFVNTINSCFIFFNLVKVFFISLIKESIWSFQRLDSIWRQMHQFFLGITKGNGWCLRDKQTVQIKCFVLINFVLTRDDLSYQVS